VIFKINFYNAMNYEKIVLYKTKANALVRMIIGFTTFGFGTNLLLFYFNQNFKNGQNEMSLDFYRFILPILFFVSFIFFIKEFFARKITIEFSNNHVEINSVLKRIKFPVSSVEKIMFYKDGVLINTDSQWEQVYEAYQIYKDSIFDSLFYNFGINIVFVFSQSKEKTIKNISIRYIPKLKKLRQMLN